MTFGEKLQALRREKKASQEETAAAAGISRRAYIGYEQEVVIPENGRLTAGWPIFWAVT